MLYYRDEDLMIRSMEEEDGRAFYDGYLAQGWHPDIATYRMRMKDEAEGKCITLTAVYRGQPAGSVYVYMTANEGPFKGKGYPIIVDFNVLQKYQRKGISLISAYLSTNSRTDTSRLYITTRKSFK